MNPDGGFDVVTYSGNSGTQSISSLNFQPDFVWIKNSNGGHNHMLLMRYVEQAQICNQTQLLLKVLQVVTI